MTVAAIRLPLSFDPARLRRDLEALNHIQPMPQPSAYHKGEWKGVALHSAGGRQSADPPRAILDPYRPTEALRASPYFEEVLAALPCPKQMVRLLSLPPGGKIGKHFDFFTGFQAGTLRLHVPIVTHPDAIMEIGGERFHWAAGELWYGDFNLDHAVSNDGPVVRTHLVIDVEITPQLVELFPAEYVEAQRALGISFLRPALPTSSEALSRFECALTVPRSAMPLLAPAKTTSLKDLMKDRPGRFRVAGDRLEFCADDETLFVLEHIAATTFKVLGWSSAVTIDFVIADDRVDHAVLSILGAPDDLLSARMGIRRGTNHEKRITFPKNA